LVLRASERGQPSARVVGHYLVGEEFDGPHGLLMGQIAPLEGADEVVGPGGDVLIQVLADRLRSHPVTGSISEGA